MNINYLKAFVLASELGSISAAARTLAKRQSQVSQWISYLEADLGVELFARSGNHAGPSPKGLALLPEVKLALQQLSRVERHAEALLHGELNRLVIGVEPYVPQQLMLPALSGLLAQSALDLEVISDSRSELLSGLRGGEVHIAVLAESDTLAYPDLGYLRVGEFAECLVVVSDHDLVRLDRVSIQDLQLHRELVWSRDASDAAHGLSPRYACLSDYSTLEHLLREGAGFALLPYLQVAPALARGELVALKTAFETEAIVRRVEVLWQPGLPDCQTGKLALDMLEQSLRC